MLQLLAQGSNNILNSDPAIQSAVIGALAGLVASFAIYFIGTIVTPISRRFKLTRKLKIKSEHGHIGNISCGIHNDAWSTTLNQVTCYVEIIYQKDDVIDFQNAHVGPQSYVPPNSKPICWSHYAKGNPNPVYIAIHAGETQDLLIGRVVQNEPVVQIASECALDPARIALKRKSYVGDLKIYSDETYPLAYSITINPEEVDPHQVLRVDPVRSWITFAPWDLLIWAAVWAAAAFAVFATALLVCYS